MQVISNSGTYACKTTQTKYNKFSKVYFHMTVFQTATQFFVRFSEDKGDDVFLLSNWVNRALINSNFQLDVGSFDLRLHLVWNFK